jgi:hypothetical protein
VNAKKPQIRISKSPNGKHLGSSFGKGEIEKLKNIEEFNLAFNAL